LAVKILPLTLIELPKQVAAKFPANADETRPNATTKGMAFIVEKSKQEMWLLQDLKISINHFVLFGLYVSLISPKSWALGKTSTPTFRGMNEMGI